MRQSIAIAAMGCVLAGQLTAQESENGSASWKAWLLGTQVNVITQHLWPLNSLYASTKSLLAGGDTKTSHAYGIYAGAKMSRRLDGYLDVEMIRGGGISQVTGLGGPTNGDVIRQGSADLGTGPYVARAYLRYTIARSGGAFDTLARAQDQVPSIVASRRIEVFAGKLALSDLFDLNRYANSTRTQFMDWALFQNSAWDFAADTRGYTNGVAVAWITPRVALRVGSFQMPTEANGNKFDSDLRRAHGDQGELTVALPWTQTVARLLAFDNHARMGSYADALARARANGSTPDIVGDDRPGRSKYGAGLNIEQPLADSGETGAFSRLGWSDGRSESFAFTEVDRHASLGVQVSGAKWRRPLDRFAVAGVVHAISQVHADYLAAGGSGFLLGDGRLRYGREQIVEAYYRLQLGTYMQVSPDVQVIHSPGYNRDRGPASVAGVRFNLRY